MYIYIYMYNHVYIYIYIYQRCPKYGLRFLYRSALSWAFTASAVAQPSALATILSWMAQESSWWICGPSVSLPAKICEVLQNLAVFSTGPMCTSATGACFLNRQALLHRAKLWPHTEGPWVKKWYLLGRTCQNKLADFGDENAWRHFAATPKLI